MNELQSNEHLTMAGAATYRIVVRGDLDPGMSDRLGGMSISRWHSDGGETETVLEGRLPDQAALSSILNALYDLQLPVISADCIASG